MVTSDTLRLAILFGAMKGFILSTVLADLDVAFWKQLVIALVGGGLTSAGVIIAAVITTRSTLQTRRDIEHIKRSVGATKRLEDKTDVDS